MIRVHIPVSVLVSIWAFLPKLKTICHKYNNGFYIRPTRPPAPQKGARQAWATPEIFLASC